MTISVSDRKIRKRRSYDARTGRNTAGAVKIAKAFVEKPTIIETKDGRTVREWRADEPKIATNAQVTKALSFQRAIERDDLGLELSPTAIKDCLTRKWLIADKMGLLWVTEKAAEELKLPRRNANGTIKFVRPEQFA